MPVLPQCSETSMNGPDMTAPEQGALGESHHDPPKHAEISVEPVSG
ncbi:hypothetical protein SAMN05216304_102811 [Bosea sp. OK403]|nr:hypothetical protein SAMN05216304_102811 [Bosea sp. OK403]